MAKLGAVSILVCGGLAACSKSTAPCTVCMTEKCAELISACEPDAGCACLVDCTGENGIPGIEACLMSCGLSERPARFIQVEECTAVACPDPEDECATPDDWKRPDDGSGCDHTGSGSIGDGTMADCGFDRQLAFDPAGTVLQLESADGNVCARIERRDDGAGTLANRVWTLLDLRVGPVGQVARVSIGTDSCWYSSHHNFRDWIHVWTGSRHFDLALKVDINGGPTVYELYSFEQGVVDAASCAPDVNGTMCIEGPIVLLPVVP